VKRYEKYGRKACSIEKRYGKKIMLNSEKIWKIWRKSKLNSEKIWKI
jgi:hypothetical protein